MKLALRLLLLACVAGAALGRTLQAPTPTEQLNAQRQQQQPNSNRAQTPTEQLNAQRQQQQAAQAVPQRRLQPPCFVPNQWYPYQTCTVSNDAAICGRGFNAWPSYNMCCAPQRGAIGAFVPGCTNFERNLTCWVVGEYHPRQTCQLTDDFTTCSRNWGRWESEQRCCAPGAAHADGCTKPEPCWVADAFYPACTCGITEDQSVCMRGWGAFPTEEDCCAPGAAHSGGCGAVQPAI